MTYTIQWLAERMGSMTTDLEAEAMKEILEENNLDVDEMTDKEFFALIPEACERASKTAWENVQDAAQTLVAKLNLFGEESEDELLQATKNGREERILDQWLESECDHESKEECDADPDCCASFPKWFVDQNEPHADAFRKAVDAWREIQR